MSSVCRVTYVIGLYRAAT